MGTEGQVRQLLFAIGFSQSFQCAVMCDDSKWEGGEKVSTSSHFHTRQERNIISNCVGTVDPGGKSKIGIGQTGSVTQFPSFPPSHSVGKGRRHLAICTRHHNTSPHNPTHLSMDPSQLAVRGCKHLDPFEAPSLCDLTMPCRPHPPTTPLPIL